MEPPPWFTPRQRILWDACIKSAPEGLLRVLDASVLEVFVVAKSLHENAAQKIAEYGAIIRSPTAAPADHPRWGFSISKARS